MDYSKKTIEIVNKASKIAFKTFLFGLMVMTILVTTSCSKDGDQGAIGRW